MQALELGTTIAPGQQHFYIDGPVGRLEMATMRPKANEKPIVAIICHPHPLHDGTMHNKVVTTAAKAFFNEGITAVRFNFRGVQHSEGDYGEGLLECDDLRAVIRWVQACLPDHTLCLAGFSFGSYVAAQVAAETKCISLLSIAPPVQRFYFKQIQRPSCPWLVIQGDSDEVVSAAAVYQWVDEFEQPPELVKLPQVGHFFHGRLIDLRNIIVERTIQPLLSQLD